MESRSILAIRLIGILWILLGLWQAAGNLVDNAFGFDPTYLGHFLHQSLLRPLLAILLGGLLLFLSRRIGRLIARGLEQVEQ